MANAIVQCEAPSGLTLTLSLYAFGSDDTLANSGGADTLTEKTNNKGLYAATVTEGLSGWHWAKILDGSSNLIAHFAVWMSDTTNVHRCVDLSDVFSWNGVPLSTTNPLPNAAADAAGGLPISDAGGLDLDTLNSNVTAILADTGTDGVVVAAGSKTGYTISGTLTTLDALDTAQDSQHATTQGYIDTEVAAILAAVDTEIASIISSLSSLSSAVAALPTDNSGCTLADGAITAAKIADNAVTAAKIASDAITAIQSGLGTAANQATIASYIDTEIASIISTLSSVSSALSTAQADLDLLTGADGATLASSQPNYAPAKAGDNMGTVSAVTGGINTGAGTITTLDGLDTAQDTQHGTTQSAIAALPSAASIASAVWSTGTRTLTTVTGLGIATAAKLLAYIQLLARSDAAIATDNATELGEINANGGSGAGDYDNTAEAQEAIRDRGDAAWTTGGGGGGGDATAANQTTIITHLTDIKGSTWSSSTDTLEELADAIAALNIGTGAGAFPVELIIKLSNDTVVAEADVILTATSTNINTNVTNSGRSDANGSITFNLDAGTYYVWRQKAGISFPTTPSTLTVESDGTYAIA